MCFGQKAQKVAAPPPPAETLQQVAPDKKTTSSNTDGGTSKTVSTPADSTNPLTIGTKKYRNNNGLGSSGLTIGGSPSGIDLNK